MRYAKPIRHRTSRPPEDSDFRPGRGSAILLIPAISQGLHAIARRAPLRRWIGGGRRKAPSSRSDSSDSHWSAGSTRTGITSSSPRSPVIVPLVPQDEAASAKTATRGRRDCHQPCRDEAIARVSKDWGATRPSMEIESRSASTSPHDSRSPTQTSRQIARRSHREGRAFRATLPRCPRHIDGETAKDFDDAVHCARIRNGFRLIVAIADVSHYVRDGDALDGAARERGTSVYFPRRVIPMLPEALSNELCSLKPDVDRLCMVCDMEVSPEGRSCTTIYRGMTRGPSQLPKSGGAVEPRRQRRGKAVLPRLPTLRVFHALKSAREARVAIDFAAWQCSWSSTFRQDVRIVPVAATTRIAHRECMLAANSAPRVSPA